LDGHEEDDGWVSTGGDGADEEGYEFFRHSAVSISRRDLRR
jgi:hypothetical protein